VSNHEVSLLNITSLDFCCVHRKRSHQTNVWSCGNPTKRSISAVTHVLTSYFSAKHDCWAGSQPAEISWHYCDLAVVNRFWRISSLAFM